MDGILATRRAVYILESKWEGPVRRRRPREEIKLGGSQTLRHEIFHWYFNAWLAECSKTWGDFLASREAEFRREFPGKEMVRKEPGERLGANLEALLRRLTCISSELVDVLLYFVAPQGTAPARVVPSKFRIVALDHPPPCALGGLYFEMG
jgi:hypothetical protein